MSQSSRPVLLGHRRSFPWAIIPPILVGLLALGLWYWRGNSTGADAGQRQLAAQQYQQAVDTFTAALSTDQNDPQTYANRGLAYAGLHQYNEAVADYGKALELAPQGPDAPTIYNNRGLAYFNLSQFDQAKADFDKAIELKPDYAVAYVNRAVLHQSLEQYDQALADYSKTIELDSTLAAAYVGRGQVYGATGQSDQALADYTQAIKLDATQAAAYNGRADIYLAQGERDKAVADLQAVVKYAQPADDLMKNKAESQLSSLGVD